MPLQPYPIYDMKSGLSLARKPWLSPQESWREVENGYPFRGRMLKRKGYTHFSDLGYPIVAEATGDGNAKGTSGAPYSDTLANFPVIPAKGTYAVRIEDSGTHDIAGADEVYDDGAGLLVHSGDGTVGTIDYATGDIVVNGLSVAFDANVTVNYEYRKTSTAPVMGIDSQFPSDGSSYLLAMDTRKLWEWDATDMRFVQFATDLDIWSGADPDFIWAEQVSDQLVLCNGVDPIVVYDGTDLIEMNTDIAASGVVAATDPEGATWPTPGGGYVRGIATAHMSFFYKNRLILLSTTEGATSNPQRARWSSVNPVPLKSIYPGGTGFPWLAEDYADAPTADWIISASVLNDDLIVFFERSVWRLSWTNDFRQPFIWEQVAQTEGSFAKMSTVDFTDEVMTMGATQITVSDGREVYSADDAIPDYVLDFETGSVKYTFSVASEEQRVTLWTVTKQGNTLQTGMLVQAYEEGGWSHWDIPGHVLGYYEFEGVDAWDDFSDTWDETTRTFDDRALRAGFPAILMGDAAGRVWLLFDGELDNGQPSTFRLRSQRLNPYTGSQATGVGRARFGQLDIICEPAEGETLTLRFFKDYESAPYLTKTLSLSPNGTDTELIRRRVLVNRSALFHQIELEHSGSKRFALDAVIPWFSQDGEARSVG